MPEPPVRGSEPTSAAPGASPPRSRPRRWGRLAMLERIVGHALTQVIVALVLIVTSFVEASQTFIDDYSNLHVRAAHGLVILGVWEALRAVPNLIEGIERYLESSRKHEA